jgi:6-phosphogluconolactonase
MGSRRWEQLLASSGVALLSGWTEGVAVTPDGRFVYVVGFGGGISGFAVNTTASLTAIPGSPFAVAAGSVDAVTDSSGKFLFVISPSGVSGFTIDSVSGALTATSPPAALPGFSLLTPGIAATTPAPANFLYAAVSGTNSVAAFSFDSTTGVLTPVNGSPFPAGAGLLTLTATLHAVYVMNSLVSTISAFIWDANTGALSPISGSPYSSPWGGGDLAVLGNQYLYVPSINNVFPPNVNAILGYSIGPSGALTPLSGSPYQAGTQLWGGLAAR